MGDGNQAALHRRNQLVKSTLNRLSKMPGKRIGVELSSVPAGVIEGLRSARNGLEILDIAPIIRKLRRAKAYATSVQNRQLPAATIEATMTEFTKYTPNRSDWRASE